MKIYQCSNTSQENDIITSLIENSILYGYRITPKSILSDVILTSNIFTPDVEKLNIPKIKIIDSLICNSDLSINNESELKSTEIADCIIFTSNILKENYIKLYPEVQNKKSFVIPRITNSKNYKTISKNIPDVEFLIAIAQDWSSPDKRVDILLDFISKIPQKLYLLGNCELDTPNNVVLIEKFDDKLLDNLLMKSQIMIDLSYKEFSTKYVSRAVAAGLPIIYTNSGSLSEVVEHGIEIEDEKNIGFYTTVPEINIMDVLKAFNDIRYNFKNFYKQENKNYLTMVNSYNKIISEYEKKIT